MKAIRVINSDGDHYGLEFRRVIMEFNFVLIIGRATDSEQRVLATETFKFLYNVKTR